MSLHTASAPNMPPHAEGGRYLADRGVDVLSIASRCRSRIFSPFRADGSGHMQPVVGRPHMKDGGRPRRRRRKTNDGDDDDDETRRRMGGWVDGWAGGGREARRSTLVAMWTMAVAALHQIGRVRNGWPRHRRMCTRRVARDLTVLAGERQEAGDVADRVHAEGRRGLAHLSSPKRGREHMASVFCSGGWVERVASARYRLAFMAYSR